jgi:hypothetical protein
VNLTQSPKHIIFVLAFSFDLEFGGKYWIDREAIRHPIKQFSLG